MFNVGDRVISDYFGEGTVVEIKTELEDRISSYPVIVIFDSDIQNGSEGNTFSFNTEGYYDYGRLKNEMIRLIDTKQKIENNSSKQILNDLSNGNRKFKIKYRDIQDYINRVDIRDSKVKIITGTIENFNTNGEIVINGDDGFCIVQYRQILQMEEISG